MYDNKSRVGRSLADMERKPFHTDLFMNETEKRPGIWDIMISSVKISKIQEKKFRGKMVDFFYSSAGDVKGKMGE